MTSDCSRIEIGGTFRTKLLSLYGGDAYEDLYRALSQNVTEVVVAKKIYDVCDSVEVHSGLDVKEYMEACVKANYRAEFEVEYCDQDSIEKLAEYLRSIRVSFNIVADGGNFGMWGLSWAPKETLGEEEDRATRKLRFHNYQPAILLHEELAKAFDKHLSSYWSCTDVYELQKRITEFKASLFQNQSYSIYKFEVEA